MPYGRPCSVGGVEGLPGSYGRIVKKKKRRVGEKRREREEAHCEGGSKISDGTF